MMPAKSFSRRVFLNRALAISASAIASTSFSAAATPVNSDNRWQIGCFTRPWANYDYRKAMDAIAEAGMEYVGLMTAKTASAYVITVNDKQDYALRVGEEAKKRGLKILSVYVNEIATSSRKLAANDLRHMIDLCASAGAKTMMLGGICNAAQYDLYFDAIADCCSHAEKHNVGLTIKPHGGLTPFGPQLRKAVEKIKRNNFTIWYDAGNILYYSNGKINPVEDAATVDGLVTGWSIKDYRHPMQVDIAPGTGQIDFPAVFARLKNGGFVSGPLLIETLRPGDWSQLLAEAKNARQFLETMIRQ